MVPQERFGSGAGDIVQYMETRDVLRAEIPKMKIERRKLEGEARNLEMRSLKVVPIDHRRHAREFRKFELRWM